MTTWLPRWFALLVLVLPFVAAASPDEAEIARLIKQLGDDDFDTREAASKRLEEIGEPAIDALIRAMTTNDLEVRRRAEAILTEIGEPALEALQQATTSDDPEVRLRAKDIVAVIEDKLYPELRLTGHAGEVRSVCVSADGKRLLTSSYDKTLRLWDTATGKQLLVFEGHTDLIYGAALSPDSKRVLSSSKDSTVRLWDATTGKALQSPPDHDRLSLVHVTKSLPRR